MSFVFDADPREISPNYRPDFSTGKSEIRTDYVLFLSVHAHLAELLADFGPETRGLYIHVLLSDRGDEKEGVPLPATTIQAFSRRAYRDLKKLMKAGLMERTETYGYHRCYCYRVPERVRRDILKAEPVVWTEKRIDPMTGKVQQRKPAKTVLYDKHKNYFWDPLLSALKVLKQGRINMDEVRGHLAESLQSAQDAAVNADRATNGSASLAVFSEARRVALYWEARYRVDMRCYDSVMAQRPKALTGEFFKYELAYKPARTGRISQKGGGLQSCSREMKSRAYTRLPEFHNYDIKSSQAYILRAEFLASGHDTEWLDDYLKGDKEEFAARVGVDVATWKRCLYAVFYGAALSFSQDFKGGDRAVREALVDYVLRRRTSGTTPTGLSVEDEARVLFNKFREEVAPLNKAVKLWRDYLTSEWLPERRKTGRAGWTVRNAAGVLLDKKTHDDWQQAKVLKRKLASFVVQGIEAGFIHTLTALLPEYGVVPISNEHDGLITVGRIPSEAVQKAKERCGTPYLDLDDKPLL